MTPSCSEDIFEYIEDNHLNNKDTLYKAFDLLDHFNYPNIEPSIRNEIYREDLEPNAMQDIVEGIFVKALLDIIAKHRIHINLDENPTTIELVAIVELLYIITKLEDYSDVKGFVSALGDSRAIFAHLMDLYGSLTFTDTLRIITKVDRELIESLEKYIEGHDNYLEFLETPHARQVAILFLEYVGPETPCTGYQLYHDGYDKCLPFEELARLLPFDLYAELTASGEMRFSQTALNILSTLMICSDTQDNPVSYYEENKTDFIEDSDLSQRVGIVIKTMYEDFMREFNTILREIEYANAGQE